MVGEVGGEINCVGRKIDVAGEENHIIISV